MTVAIGDVYWIPHGQHAVSMVKARQFRVRIINGQDCYGRVFCSGDVLDHEGRYLETATVGLDPDQELLYRSAKPVGRAAVHSANTIRRSAPYLPVRA